MKNLPILIIILVLIPALIMAQDGDYKVPKNLNAEDFQMPADKEFLEKFDGIKIPILMQKVIKTEEEYIIPWLRQKTADVHDYELTIGVMRQGVLVTDKQFPHIRAEVDACAEVLHLAPPRVFIVGSGGMKADAVNFKEPFILLPAELVEKSNVKALRFAIGRQIGHIKCDHVFYRSLTSGGLGSLEFVLGKWVQELIKSFFEKIGNLVLVDWKLASEISADRAGLIACQDLDVAQNMLLNFKLAMAIEEVKLNVEDYLNQVAVIQEKQDLILKNMPGPVQEGINRWQRSNRSASAHPFIFQRIKALQEYAESDAYRKLFE